MHSWFHYRRAFAVIDDPRVVEAMETYLRTLTWVPLRPDSKRQVGS